MNTKLEAFLEDCLDVALEKARVMQLKTEATARGRESEESLTKKFNTKFTGRIKKRNFTKIDELVIFEQAEDF